MNGLFITFEGIDGCGKSTHLEKVRQTLQKRGLTVRSVREPGGTWVGEKIRSILLDKTGHGMDPMAELLLFSAARAQHVRDVLLPALQDGEIVLCDRYTDSTLAYQGYGREMDREQIRRINETATGGLVPDHTFLFDLTVEEATQRMTGRKLDRMEENDSAFRERVRAGYLALAREEPERFVVIDAGGSVEETAHLLSQKLKEVVSI